MNFQALLPWQLALAVAAPALLLAVLALWAWSRARRARRQLHEEQQRRASLDDELVQAQASLRHCREHLRGSELQLRPLQQQLQTLDAALPQAEADAQGRLLIANARFGRIEPQPAGWAEVWAQAEPLLRAGSSWQGLLNLGGEPPRWLGVGISRIESEDGKEPPRYLVAGVELPALARQQRELLDTVERQAEVLDGQRAGGWSWEPSADRLRLDRRALALLGLPAAGNLIGAGSLLLERLHPQDQAAWRRALARHLRGQDPDLHLALRLRHAEGHWLPLQLRAAIVQRDAAGEPQRLAGTLQPLAPLRPEDEAGQRLLDSAQTRAGLGSLRWRPGDDGGEGVFEWSASALALQDQAAAPACLQLEQALQAWHADDRAIFAKALEQARLGRPWQGELRLRRALAGERWVHLALVGDADQVLGVLQDVDAQRLLRAEQRFLQLAVDRQPGGVAYWSRELRCLFANRRYAELLELTPAQLLGARLEDLPFREALHAQLGRVAAVWEGESLRFEMQHQGRPLLLVCEPDGPATGAVNGLTLVVLDVSDLKDEQRRVEALNASLAAERERVQSLAAGHSQLLISLSQDLRGPVENLRSRGAAEPALRELLDRIDELADLGRLEAGSLALNRQSLALDGLLRDLAASWADLAERGARGAETELVYELDPDLPALVEGDAQRLRQLLLVLGRELLTQGSESLRLQIRRLEGGGQHLRLGFALLGRGRPPTGPSEGLALAQGLVERMGGQLSLHAQPGESDYRFGFDLVMPQPPEQPPATPALGLRVLLLEAHAASREALGRLIAAEGCEQRSAAHLAGASELLADGWRPDCLWLGASLLLGGGEAGLRELLAACGHPRWLLAGRRSEREALDALGLLDVGNAEAPELFVIKPVSRGPLREALLRRRAAAAPAAALSVPPALQQRCLAQGLDLQRALQRFLGRPELLRRMSQSFAASAASLPGRLRARSGQGQQGVQALHAFKGLAGTLACERLAHWARIGEQRLAAGQGLEPVWLEEFEQQLEAGTRLLLEATEALLLTAAAPSAAPPSQAPPALQRLDTLRALVAARDAGASRMLESERAQLAPWLGEAQLDALVAALNAGDFDQAAALLG